MAKSTGPRTPRGKARSSQNAAKHWIESRRILPDEQNEAANLRNGFSDDFKPQGLIENELIDDLTFNRLIKRRIDVAYTREFSKASNEKSIRLIENTQRSGTHFWLRAANLGHKDWAVQALGDRLRPDLCIEFLEGLKEKISDRGILPNDLGDLRLFYGNQATEGGARAMYELVPGTSHTADKKEKIQDVLTALEAEIKNQNSLKEIAEEAVEIETASDLQEPARAALDTLLRYRASNGRELKDLLNCFEIVRRLRGAAV